MNGLEGRLSGRKTAEYIRDILAKVEGIRYDAGGPPMSRDPMRDLSQVGGAGFTLVAYVLVFTGIGYGLDRLLGTRPWLMVGGVFLGAGLGFVYMVRMLIGAGRAAQEDDDGGGRPGGPSTKE
jgi:ATP synthase protein I